jgi:hypothetical protein
LEREQRSWRRLPRGADRCSRQWSALRQEARRLTAKVRQEVAGQLATVATVATVATEVPVPATEREAVEQAAATIVQVVRE